MLLYQLIDGFSQWSGFSKGETHASSHNCLLNSACLARRSALESFVLLGNGSAVGVDNCYKI